MRKIKSLAEILGLMSKSSRIDAVYDLAGKIEIPRQYLDEAISTLNRDGYPLDAISIAKNCRLQDVAEDIYQKKIKQYKREQLFDNLENLAKAYGRPEDAVNIHVRRKDYTHAALAARNVGLKELADKYFKMSPVAKLVEKVLTGKKRKR